MKKIIWLTTYVLIALIIPFILLAYLNGWIALISLVIIIFVAYKFQDSPAKIPKIIANKYITATSELLPIERKLLLVVVISGGLFLLADTISFMKFYISYMDSIWESIDYARDNFMLPHPSSLDFLSREWHQEWWLKELGIQRFGGSMQRWSWYADEVFLTGLIFVISLFFFLISVIMSRVISEKTNIAK